MSTQGSSIVMHEFSESDDLFAVADQRSLERMCQQPFVGLLPSKPYVGLSNRREEHGAFDGGSSSDWREQVMEAYRVSKPGIKGKLQVELANRLLALTGCEIPANLVYADPDRRTARVSLDGISFRLIHDRLVLLMPCSYCGLGEFESSPLVSRADLGYTLSVWKPYCRDCEPVDITDWA